MCSYSAIDKEEIEKFVTAAVRESLNSQNFSRRVSKHVEEILQLERVMVRSEIDRLRKEIQEKELAAKNLAGAIAKSGGSATLLRELQLVETEKRDLEYEILLQRSQRGNGYSNQELTRLVDQFFSDFDSGFEGFSLEEKRQLIRKCVAQLVVDRESGTVNCYIRKIPLLTPAIRSIYEDVEKSKKAAFLRPPFRNVEVAGTRTFSRVQLWRMPSSQRE